MIRTKVVATVGPACTSEAVLGEMIEAGVNVFRLNFSHGTHEAREASLALIRKVAAERGTVVAVMGDLCGPKIRLGSMEGGKCSLAVGRRVVCRHQPQMVRVARPPKAGQCRLGCPARAAILPK